MHPFPVKKIVRSEQEPSIIFVEYTDKIDAINQAAIQGLLNLPILVTGNLSEERHAQPNQTEECMPAIICRLSGQEDILGASHYLVVSHYFPIKSPNVAYFKIEGMYPNRIGYINNPMYHLEGVEMTGAIAELIDFICESSNFKVPIESANEEKLPITKELLLNFSVHSPNSIDVEKLILDYSRLQFEYRTLVEKLRKVDHRTGKCRYNPTLDELEEEYIGIINDLSL